MHTAVTAALALAVLGLLYALICERRRRIALSREMEQTRAELEKALDSAREYDEKILQTKEACRAEILKFHSSISHGLRLPLAIIQGYADLLAGDLVHDEAASREYLDKIRERVCYVNDLLSKLLAEARGEADMPSIAPSRIDILDLIRRIATDSAPFLNGKGINVQVVTPEEHVYAEADATHLTKIFYNILENSAKYMCRPGNIYITVSYTEEGEILLIFKDDGMGIESSECEKIFDRNYQGKNGTTGSGMGLYLAKIGITAHGGSIFAKSDLGKGMGIYITLPAGGAVSPA